MRTLEFRMWDNNKMLLDPILDDGSISNGVDINAGFHNTTSEGAIWMQFSGLFDKNETKIYEGDIVFVHFHDKDSPEENYEDIVQIIWDEFSCAFRALNVDDDIYEIWDDPQLFTLEIKGNIYENPELYKEYIPNKLFI